MDCKLMWAVKPKDEGNACTYYRVLTPLRQLKKLNDMDFYVDRGQNVRESLHILTQVDIAHFYGLNGPEVLDQIRVLKDMKAVVSPDQTKIPPTLIHDMDDNSDYVHPYNFMAYVLSGVRGYPEPELLKPSTEEETITIEFEKEDGERVVLWEDKVTEYEGSKFDIARNLRDMKIRHEIIRTCHGATVTTPALASYYKEVIKQPNTYVYPNTVVLEDYEFYDVVHPKTDEIRVLWQGGSSHFIDWYPLRDAIIKVSKKYPKMKWVIFGEWMDWVHKCIPKEQLEQHPFIPPTAYRIKRGLLNIDINLCILANNVFNRCKSAVKWYEASIWKNPEATLAANVEPYKEIEDGESGLLYNSPDEFVEKLSILIENAELRKKLGANAKKWVLNNRTPEKTIPGLFEFYRETRERHARELVGPKVVLPTYSEMKRLTRRKDG